MISLCAVVADGMTQMQMAWNCASPIVLSLAYIRSSVPPCCAGQGVVHLMQAEM